MGPLKKKTSKTVQHQGGKISKPMVTENPTCEHSSRDEKPVSNLLCESDPGARGAWGVHKSKCQESRCNFGGGGACVARE